MNTTIIPSQIQAVAAMNQGQTQGTQMPADGAFSQLLMEMLGGGMGEGQGSLLDTLFGLGEGRQQDQADTPWNNAAALQMAAAGLLTPNLYFSLLGSEDAATANLVSSLNAGSTAQQGNQLLQLLNVLGGDASPDGLQPGNTVGAFTLPAGDAAAQAEQLASGGTGISLTVETGQESTGSDSLFSGMEQFRRSVSEAQKALAADKDKKSTVPLDIEALQQKADSTRIDTAGLNLGATENLPTKEGVAAQMKEHILQNLANGKDEFVVKLKPESLGEITVKMQEKDGKITLSIITANPQTAKLLNETADALRNTLRPLQAEIREIIPRPEQAGASQQGSWLGGGFENFQRQQFAQQHSHGNSSSFQSGFEMEEEMTAEPEIQAYGLNSYI